MASFTNNENEFLLENEDELIVLLKNEFSRNLTQREEYFGYYRVAYDEKLAGKMRSYLKHELGQRFNLNPAEIFELESDIMETIIKRSIYE